MIKYIDSPYSANLEVPDAKMPWGHFRSKKNLDIAEDTDEEAIGAHHYQDAFYHMYAGGRQEPCVIVFD